MTAHPTDEQLFACANGEYPEARDHLRACRDCAPRYMRIATGAALIATAKRESTPPIDWSLLDAKVFAAADRVAAEIRAGNVRPIRRAPLSRIVVGVALAAAAAGVFALRMRAGAPSRDVDRAHRAAPHGASSGSERPASGRNPSLLAAQSRPAEATVLLVALPATYTPAGESTRPLTADVAVREGGRLTLGDRAGRAVLAVHTDYRVDVRRGGELAFATLRTDRAVFGLVKGDVRVEGPDPGAEGPSLAIESSGWSVQSKGGAFVASVEDRVVRVRVLQGKVTVRRGDGAEREILAGSEVELQKDGDGLNIVARTSPDADAIDLSSLSPTSRAVSFATPALAEVEVVSHGRWPLGLASVRAVSALELRVRRDDGSTATLRLDPASGATAPPWVVAAPSPLAAAQVPAASVSVTPVRNQPRAMAAAHGAPVAASVATEVPLNPVQQMVWNNVQASLSRRTDHCFQECSRRGACGPERAGRIEFELDPAGSVRSTNVTGFSAPDVRACLRLEAMRMRVPPGMPSPLVSTIRNRMN